MANPGPIPTAVIVDCTALPSRAISSYSGFKVRRSDNKQELALFYSGDPFLDFDEAEAYAKSVSTMVLVADNTLSFWKELGVDLDKEVSNG